VRHSSMSEKQNYFWRELSTAALTQAEIALDIIEKDKEQPQQRTSEISQVKTELSKEVITDL
jgi:hypothetical protein